jgi:hypothetical protein
MRATTESTCATADATRLTAWFSHTGGSPGGVELRYGRAGAVDRGTGGEQLPL